MNGIQGSNTEKSLCEAMLNSLNLLTQGMEGGVFIFWLRFPIS